jgi:DNA-binding transcriptional regulator PaaX
MATLPTAEEAERAILNVFKRFGTRPGESIKSIALMDLMAGSNPFRVDDLNAALQAMAGKGWIEERRTGFYTLTEAGYAAV